MYDINIQLAFLSIDKKYAKFITIIGFLWKIESLSRDLTVVWKWILAFSNVLSVKRI